MPGLLLQWNAAPLAGPFPLGSPGRWAALIEGLLAAYWLYHTGHGQGYRAPIGRLSRALLERVALRNGEPTAHSQADAATRLAIDMAVASGSFNIPNGEWTMELRP